MKRYFHIFRKVSTLECVIIALLIIHLLPIWIFKYFPSQDGASHVYNAYILKEYHDPAMYKTRECFQLNLTLFPNWFSHVFMAGLMFLVPALVAEKILLSLCIGLVPISLFYCLRAIGTEHLDRQLADCGKSPQPPFQGGETALASMFGLRHFSAKAHQSGNYVFGFLGFLFGYNYLLHMGFYNFALSFSVFLFTLGYWWRNRESMSLARIGLLYVLLILIYFCHIVSYGLILIALSICALWVMPKPRKLLAFAGYMLPAGFIMVNYLLNEATDKPHLYLTSQQLKDFFLKTKSLVYFHDSYIWINYILLGFIGALILWTIWKDKIQPRRWLARRDVFLILSAIFVAMYFKMPRFVGTGGWITERIHLFYIPILLLWLNLDVHRIAKWCAIGVMILLSLCHLGYSCRDYYEFNREMDDFTAAVGLLPDHIVFARTDPDDWGGFKKYSTPHLASFFYYGLEGDRTYINNYEAEFNYFPFNFKGDNKRDHYAGGFIDYYLAWNVKNDSPIMELYREDYRVIYSNPHLKILQHKYRSQDAKAWEKYAGNAGVMSFRMQAEKEESGDVPIPVLVDTRYQPGGFGWDTIYPRYDFSNGVWDTEDAAFRVDLPDGKYEVTCRFQSNDKQEHGIDLFANGNRVIRGFAVPGNAKEVERKFTVEVTDGTLILVIHAASRKYDAHWVWSGFTVRQLGNGIISRIAF